MSESSTPKKKEFSSTESHRNNTLKTKKNHSKTTKTVAFIIFITAWLIASNIISQYLVGYPLVWILGASAIEPFWTLVYYILNYAVAIGLTFFVPLLVIKLWQKSNQQKAAVFKNTKNELSTSSAELGIDKYPTFVDIGLAPVAYIVYQVVASVLTWIVSVFFSSFDPDQAQEVGFNHLFSFSDRAFAILAIVFVAPIAEELMMRGWLYGKLRSKLHGLRGVTIAIIITSLTFAVMHGQLNVGITVFILSVILCLLREVTGSIWSGMLLHMLTNGIAFYVVYVLMGV